jgi:D-alanine-D-alanine ligase
MRRKRRLNIGVIYNRDEGSLPERREDRGSTRDLTIMIRRIANALRTIGCIVSVLPLKRDLFSFQRRLRRLRPDVVFNQYEDVVHGALYEMRVAALVQMMGYPMTGSPPLALGLSRYKGMAASLLQGAGVPVPPQTALLERVGDVNAHRWHFPLIVQPSQEHAGIGLDRDSIMTSKKALRAKVNELLRTFRQPVLVQSFLPGREFNVGLVGGRRLRVMPLAEVDFSKLPPHIPPIMSYAAKFFETSEEYEKTTVICPAEVEPELAREISSTALRAFRAVGGWGYGRVDIRLDEEGRPYVLEVNCNPCLEEGTGLARSADRAGISYPQLLGLIVKAALERHPFEVMIPMIAPPRSYPPGEQALEEGLQSRNLPV